MNAREMAEAFERGLRRGNSQIVRAMQQHPSFNGGRQRVSEDLQGAEGLTAPDDTPAPTVVPEGESAFNQQAGALPPGAIPIPERHPLYEKLNHGERLNVTERIFLISLIEKYESAAADRSMSSDAPPAAQFPPAGDL